MNIILGDGIIVDRILTVKKGNLKAYCNVQLQTGLRINSVRIIQQPSQAAWVSMPQSEWTDATGAKRYTTIVELPAELKATVSTAVLAAWAKHLDGGGGSNEPIQ